MACDAQFSCVSFPPSLSIQEFYRVILKFFGASTDGGGEF